MREGSKMVEMTVVRLDTDPKTKHEMVWLQSVEHDVVLPIVIGHTEFMAIYAELAGERTPRPLTYDLLRAILDHFDTRVEEVQIVDLKDGIFYAELVLSSDGELLRLDARPSDSIALSLKYGAPIYMSNKVLRSAGIKINSKQAERLLLEASAGPAAEAPKEEVNEVEGDADEVEEEAEDVEEEAEEPGGKASEEDVALAVEGLLAEAGLAGFRGTSEEDLDKRVALLKKRMAWAVETERYEEAGQLKVEIEKIQKGREDT